MDFFSQIGFANVQIIEPHLFFLRIWRNLRTVALTLVIGTTVVRKRILIGTTVVRIASANCVSKFASLVRARN